MDEGGLPRSCIYILPGNSSKNISKSANMAWGCFYSPPSTSTHLLFILICCLEPWNYSTLWEALTQPPSEACWAPKCDKKLIKMIWALKQP